MNNPAFKSADPSALHLQSTSQWLTCSGALPIMLLTWYALATASSPAWLLFALTSYAALILSFLGGIHWGRGLERQRPARFFIAVLPALYAWGVIQLPWPWPPVALALGFGLMLWLDVYDVSLSAHYRQMRQAVTFVVVLHLLVAAWLIPAPSVHAAKTPEDKAVDLNVLNTPLQLCSSNPRTGFYRNGYCQTGEDDRGTHTVCAVVTEDFLQYTLQQGNDLITPRPDYKFPGLNPGDRWCLCALRWLEAYKAGVAPPVVLEASKYKSLEFIERDVLLKHAYKVQ